MTIPDSGDGYLSVMVVNQDHNITATPNDDGSVTVHFGGADNCRT